MITGDSDQDSQGSRAAHLFGCVLRKTTFVTSVLIPCSQWVCLPLQTSLSFDPSLSSSLAAWIAPPSHSQVPIHGSHSVSWLSLLKEPNQASLSNKLHFNGGPELRAVIVFLCVDFYCFNLFQNYLHGTEGELSQ